VINVRVLVGLTDMRVVVGHAFCSAVHERGPQLVPRDRTVGRANRDVVPVLLRVYVCQVDVSYRRTDLPDLYSFKSLKYKEKCTFHLNYVVTKKRGF
jgi:hypothetical protein